MHVIIIIKELAKEFQGQDFNCLGKHTENNITFSVALKK